MSFIEIWNEGYNIYSSARDSGKTEYQAWKIAREVLLCHEAEGNLSDGMFVYLLSEYKETYEL